MTVEALWPIVIKTIVFYVINLDDLLPATLIIVQIKLLITLVYL